MGHSGIPTKQYKEVFASRATFTVDEVEPFDFGLKAIVPKEQNDSAILGNAAIAAVQNDNLDQSGDSFDFRSSVDDGSIEGWGIPWREISEFIIEILPDEKPGPTPNPGPASDEMPGDFPEGLVVQQDFDLIF